MKTMGVFLSEMETMYPQSKKSIDFLSGPICDSVLKNFESLISRITKIVWIHKVILAFIKIYKALDLNH